LAIDGFVGYESWSIASGNGNSVKPGDPSGYSLGVLGRTHFWRGQKLFFLATGGLRSFHGRADRSASQIQVHSELDAVFLGIGPGLGVEVNRALSFEGVLNLDYAPYSAFHYNAKIEGFVPIRGDSSLSRLYRFGMGIRAFYRVVPNGHIGVEFAPYTGSYLWTNPGTSETQRDSFSGIALRLTYRHFIFDQRPVVKKPDKGRRVGDGVWVKRELNAKPSGVKSPRAKPLRRKPSSASPPRRREP
jgi:hypothetical protein